MSDHTFNETVESLFKGMDNFLTTKTVVGEAIHVNDTLILPLVDVSFGVGAGAWSQEHKNSAGGGMGGKMTPSAVLVIKDGSVRIVPVNNNDPVSKIIDMALPITEYSCFILCFLTDSVLLSNKIKHALSALLVTLLLKCVQPLIPQLHHLLTCS